LDKSLDPVPIGATGELYFGGAQLARGYLNRPEFTAERFIPDRFSLEPGSRLYRTGDLARWLPDGNVGFVGRADQQVKLRGHRIELGEIEAALAEHPALRQAVVILRKTGGGGSELVAYVVAEPGQDVAATSLREYLKQILPDPMVPTAYVPLDKFPLTASGKVDRTMLPAPDRVVTLHVEHEPPQTETELQIARVWRELLELENVGLRDNFFELGGHSMLATVLVSRLRDEFGVDLSVRQLFKGPTVAELAESVNATRWAVESLEAATSSLSASSREEGRL
jgi:acyl carrier protein